MARRRSQLGFILALSVATTTGCGNDEQVTVASETTVLTTTTSTSPPTTSTIATTEPSTTYVPTTVLASIAPIPTSVTGSATTVAAGLPPPTVGPMPGGRYVTEPDDEVTLGDAGPAVLQIQDALVKSGYTVTIDGVFGLTTQTQVRAFQQATGLNADGIVGRMTWAALQFAMAAA